MDGRRAHGARNQDHVFQPGEALAQRPAHEIIPALACGHGNARVVAFLFLLTARQIRWTPEVTGTRGAGTVTVVAALAYPADLVRGSNIAVAMSASRIATSTARVMSRNSACISG